MSHPTKTHAKLMATVALVLPLVSLASISSAIADDDTNQPIVKAANPPKVLLISLDGAKPDLIQRYLAQRVLPANGGLGTLSKTGVVALQNVTATPSLTAVSHLTIATGSTAVHTDVPANSFHQVATPITSSTSGFGAPIGGYEISPVGPSDKPTAEPLWVKLRAAGKKVAAATWPGADGVDVRVNSVVVQPAEPTRVTDYTVPFGAFGGLGAVGFTLTGDNFKPAGKALQDQLTAAGKTWFSPVRVTAPFETVYCGATAPTTCSTSPLDLKFEMRVAALDTTDDGKVNYDTLVFFEKTAGIQPGPFAKPETGPAYAKLGGASGKFFYTSSGSKVGTAFFATFIAADLSTVRFTRYSANYIPRNAPVLADVDDINNNVGFWAPQADYRIPERLSPGYTNFPDKELEAIYEDQAKTFVQYQTKIAQRAIARTPGADLVMVYIEQPDGSGHQFTLTDPRQATDPTNPSSIGAGQNRAKVNRYANYLKSAYKFADKAVSDLMETVGSETNVFVVSDHGMSPFHTAVNMTNLLKKAGIDTTQLSIRTSGPAVNIYVNLKNRESGGTVGTQAYLNMVKKIADTLTKATDPNKTFNYSLKQKRIFSSVIRRPANCVDGVGLCTNSQIGQDFGDVFAIMAEGYNFDGIQNPGVARLGDAPFDPATTVFSTPNFYGAHGHDSNLSSMSASFLAAGPAIRRNATIARVNNIDVSPTIMHLLGVEPAKMDGRVLTEILK